MCVRSVQKRVFARAGARWPTAVPHAGAVLAEHRVQPGGRVRVPARPAVAPSRAGPGVVPVVRGAQGPVRAHTQLQQPVAGRRAHVVVRAAQPVVRGLVQPRARAVAAAAPAAGPVGSGRTRDRIAGPRRRRRHDVRLAPASAATFAVRPDGERLVLVRAPCAPWPSHLVRPHLASSPLPFFVFPLHVRVSNSFSSLFFIRPSFPMAILVQAVRLSVTKMNICYHGTNS